mmetsp:Transcript_103139/g.315550  ORF Transcript_103139/g.315550 Transcript_103139/m.315550 type:complete len:204 (+) Transcript_103139:975-1586(+)
MPRLLPRGSPGGDQHGGRLHRGCLRVHQRAERAVVRASRLLCAPLRGHGAPDLGGDVAGHHRRAHAIGPRLRSAILGLHVCSVRLHVLHALHGALVLRDGHVPLAVRARVGHGALVLHAVRERREAGPGAPRGHEGVRPRVPQAPRYHRVGRAPHRRVPHPPGIFQAAGQGFQGGAHRQRVLQVYGRHLLRLVRVHLQQDHAP